MRRDHEAVSVPKDTMTPQRLSALADLFGPWHGPEQHEADPALAMDRALSEIIAWGGLGELRTQVAHVLETAKDSDDVIDLLAYEVGQADFVDGPYEDWLGLLHAIDRRLAEVAKDPAVLPTDIPGHEPKRNARTSEFADGASVARAQDALVAANREAVEAFLRNATGWDHIALYGDVGTEIGRVTAGGQLEHTTFPQSWGVHTPTSHAVVVLGRADHGDGTYLDTAYPELPLDETVRSTYPNLCQFFTLTYHQHRSIPVNDVRWTMTELRNPAWSAVRDELSLLLHVDDDLELRRIVEHCGSYLVPHNVRHWVDRLRWRFDAFDWHPDRHGVL